MPPRDRSGRAPRGRPQVETLEERCLLSNAPVPADYDGDGKADPAVYVSASARWYVLESASGASDVPFGGPSTDVPVPADYDGDGRTDIAVYRPSIGWWLLDRSSAGPGGLPFGMPNLDIPVPADYNGDGKADIAVFRPTTGQWIIRLPSGAPKVINFPNAINARPVPADYDGDGKIDPAVYNPANAQWTILESKDGLKTFTLGAPKLDIPVPADYDGDGKADIAVFRPTTAQWVIQQSTLGRITLTFGTPRIDLPAPADYDGDGKADIAVYRPATDQWLIQGTTSGLQVRVLSPPTFTETRQEPIWWTLHEQYFSEAQQATANVVFLGDSITYFFGDDTRDDRGSDSWVSQILQYGAANFGIRADTTQSVLWRVQNGEMAGHPKVVVLMIGINDLKSLDQSAVGTAAGIQAVVRAIQAASPTTRILLMGLLPSGDSPNDPLRAKIKLVNTLISRMADGRTIAFLDIGDKFLRPDGTLDRDLVPDGLHPSAVGYAIWASALQDPLTSLLSGDGAGLKRSLSPRR